MATTLDHGYDLSNPKQEQVSHSDNMKSFSWSIPSEVSNARELLAPSDFHPGTTLHIAARGIGPLRCALLHPELEIPVFDAGGSLAYVSRRQKRCSGNAVLSHPQRGGLISTSYFFGPKREPQIRLLQGAASAAVIGNDDANIIKVSGRWSSRTVSFTTPDGQAFEWKYARTKDANGKKVNIIALQQIETQESKPDSAGKIIAQLVRGNDTRAEGSSRCSAGNGGQLVLDQDAAIYLDEAMILATCLVMLKKEIDRRTTMQIMILA
ncbi:hypothetical protein A1O3_09562 [Capronia epimyces CBS 606.96]|uniref:Uncharacterized protein n=1 Tax=Capronia epimyces CBS 606.96 TaxID=1182542 RepID=W9XK75_9EURO|nr:uncharacterized protein A1O3_09562 [Capronia epimyces CBS 606.96]EXJ77336.1 hypothetical protein A1O3_09562 [Capronia epimyces CBS 606.96]